MGSHDGDLAFFFPFFFGSCCAFSLAFTIFTGPYFFLCSCASCWHLLVIKVIKVTLGWRDLIIKISASRPLAGPQERDQEIVRYCYGLQGFTSMVVVAGADALADIFSLMTVEHGGWGLGAGG